MAGVEYGAGEWGIVDRDSELRPVEGRYLRPLSEGHAQFETKDGRQGFLDAELNVVIPPIYRLTADFSEGLAWATEEYEHVRSYFLNPNGARVLTFDTPCDMMFSDGLLAVRSDGLWGYVNRDQEWVIRPAYHFAYPFLGEMTRIQVDGKWGFLNAEGDIVVEPQYDGVWPFSEGLAAVQVEAVWGFINAMGDMVTDPQFVEAGMFHEGRCAAAVSSDVARRIS